MDGSLNSRSPKRNGNSYPDLIFPADTKTRRKTDEYGVIALAQKDVYRMNAVFFLLDEFSVSRSAVEYGVTAEENARLKATCTAPDFDRLREGRDLHKPFVRRLGNRGYSYNPFRTYRMSEDSPLALPEDVYEQITGPLKLHVDPQLVRSSLFVDKDKKPIEIDGKRFRVLIDSGQIMAHGEMPVFWDIVRQGAAASGNYKDRRVPVLDVITTILTRLSDPVGAPDAPSLTIHKKLYLHTPNGLDKPFSPSDAIFPHSGHYLATEENAQQPILHYWDRYLRHESARKKMLDKIITHVATLDADNSQRHDFKSAAQYLNFCARKERREERKKKNYVVVQPTDGYTAATHVTVSGVGTVTVKRKPPKDAQSLMDLMDMRFPVLRREGGAAVRRCADAVVFMPFDANNPVLCARNTLALEAGLVAKTLDPEYMHVPYIVVNTNNCYGRTLGPHLTAVNEGFSKNHMLDAAHPRRASNIDGVPYLATDLCDILGGKDADAAIKVIGKVIDARNGGDYARLTLPRMSEWQVGEGGKPRPAGHPVVTVYISASSDKRWLMESAHRFGGALAEDSALLVWGGMNQHAGGSPYFGYVAAKGLHTTGISTPGIIKVETEFGQLPPCDYWKLTRHLGERTVELIRPAKLIVSFPGGEGSTLEDSVQPVAKKLMPWLVADKSFLYFDPDFGKSRAHAGMFSIKTAVIRANYGEDAPKRLAKDHDAFAHEGFFLATDETELRRRSRELMAKQAPVLDERVIVLERPSQSRSAFRTASASGASAAAPL